MQRIGLMVRISPMEKQMTCALKEAKIMVSVSVGMEIRNSDRSRRVAKMSDNSDEMRPKIDHYHN